MPQRTIRPKILTTDKDDDATKRKANDETHDAPDVQDRRGILRLQTVA